MANDKVRDVFWPIFSHFKLSLCIWEVLFTHVFIVFQLEIAEGHRVPVKLMLTGEWRKFIEICAIYQKMFELCLQTNARVTQNLWFACKKTNIKVMGIKTEQFK